MNGPVTASGALWRLQEEQTLVGKWHHNVAQTYNTVRS